MQHSSLRTHRLGFGVNVLGAPLRSHDSRRWQNDPHLSVSLAYLRDIFAYLDHHAIRFYRLAGQLAPYLTHPGLPQFHGQIDACALELAAVGDMARERGIRLSMHPSFHVQLSSADEGMAARAAQELDAAAQLLDCMGLDGNAVLVVHVGSAYGAPETSRERFVRHYERLSNRTRARLVLEHDDRHFDLADTHWIFRRTGIPLVFDALHHRVLNRAGWPMHHALATALATWPPTVKPKIHFSSPRTAVRPMVRNRKVHLRAPLPNQHSDFLHPFEFIDFVRAAKAAALRPFDIMLEAKGKDLALLQLRRQVATFAPDVATWLG